MNALTPPVSPRDHVIGSADAPVTLVEYGDFQCPHCRAAHPIISAVREKMGDDLRFVFRHFPMATIHAHAEHAAEMAEAAGQRGRFWAMHDLLFEFQDALNDAALARYADALGMDSRWAAAALADGLFRERVRQDFMSGVRSGVNGTPTFFINGARYDGSWEMPVLLDALDAELARLND